MHIFWVPTSNKISIEFNAARMLNSTRKLNIILFINIMQFNEMYTDDDDDKNDHGDDDVVVNF